MPPVLGAGNLLAVLLTAFYGASDLPPALAVGVIAGVVAIATTLITALVQFFLNRRSSDDTWTLGLIRETQESQKSALDSANARLIQQDRQIAELRAEVATMRIELAAALTRHAECEDARAISDAVIRQLRQELKGPQA